MARPGPDERLIELWAARRAAGASYELIAHLWGTSESRVRRALGGGGIRGARRRTQVPAAEVVSTWLETGSQRQTAALLGCSRTLVVRRLAEADLIDWPEWLRRPEHPDALGDPVELPDLPVHHVDRAVLVDHAPAQVSPGQPLDLP